MTRLLVVALALVTRDRVTVYADEPTFWADAYGKMGPTRQTFLSAQIYANHGAMLWNQGRLDEAHDCFERAVACANPTATPNRAPGSRASGLWAGLSNRSNRRFRRGWWQEALAWRPS